MIQKDFLAIVEPRGSRQVFDARIPMRATRISPLPHEMKFLSYNALCEMHAGGAKGQLSLLGNQFWWMSPLVDR
jgi:hypothetical protein